MIVRWPGFKKWCTEFGFASDICSGNRTSVCNESLDSDIVAFKVIHTGTHCEIAHTRRATRKQEIFKSFKGHHLAAASSLSFTYPSILSSLLSGPSFENECTSTGAVAAVEPQNIHPDSTLWSLWYVRIAQSYLRSELRSSTSGFHITHRYCFVCLAHPFTEWSFFFFFFRSIVRRLWRRFKENKDEDKHNVSAHKRCYSMEKDVGW